ncbi:MAG: TonB family protein [Chitinophagaceae bacterium]
MLTILYYCLKVIFCSGVLLGYYWLALRNNRFHQWNRYYLLLATVLPFVLPLLKIPIPFFATAEETPLLIRGVEMAGISDLYIARLSGESNFHFTWQLAIMALYLAGATFLVVVFIKNITKIQRLKKLYPCEFIEGIQFYNTQEQGTPFSFFRNIFWNKRIGLNTEKGQQMLAHELAHITEKHSNDKVFIEILIALAWWNPVLYFIRRELAVIHEFIADKKASAGDENLQYASLLLMKAMGSEQFALANPFFHSQLKRRLAMLTSSNNPKFSYVRRLMVLPLMAISLVLFSFKYRQLQEGLLKAPEPLTVVIDAGHGGADNGAISATGVREDAVALQIALKIKELSAGTNIKVVLTRSTDTLPGYSTNKEVALKYRTTLSKENNADFFISLHLNSGNKKTPDQGRGIECFVSNKESIVSKQSRVLASGILDELSGSGMPVATNLKSNKDKGVYVLDENTIPSILLELGYLTNPADATFIQQPKNQEAIARHILNGIAKHGQQAKQSFAMNTTEVELKEVPVKALHSDSVFVKLVEKRPATITTSGKYKGVPIEKIVPTADYKGVVVTTTDQKTYFLNREEAKKEVGITITDNNRGSTADEWERAARGETAEKKPVEIKIRNENLLGSKDPENQPLYVLDGEIKGKEILNQLNPADIATINVLKGENATNLYGDKAKNGIIIIATKQSSVAPPISLQKADPIQPDDNYDRIFTKAEQPASFLGGEVGWRNYLMNNLIYPENAQVNGTQAAVKVQLTVNTDGSIRDAKALNSPGDGLAEEAVRLINKGPKWIPAKQNDRLVASRFLQTITFQLGEAKLLAEPAY